jgi:hypothetical protein
MTENPYLKRASKTQHGRKAEKKAAKRLRGSLTPASGALQHAKGDIRKGQFLLDSKATVKQSFRVTTEQLAKISKEALDSGKDPALLIQFVDDSGHLHVGAWVMIPERVFKELAE